MKIRQLLQAFLAMALTHGCAGHIPLPEAYKVDDAKALALRMESGKVAARTYSGEARLNYYGPAGRFKGTASLLVARPDKFRYELQGPHGGVLVAVACDGAVLSTLDLRDGKFNQVKAEPQNLDRLLGLMPLGMNAAGWVQLLFGEVNIPVGAALHYDDHDGVYVLDWTEGSRRFEVNVAPSTGRVIRATVWDGGEMLSTIRITKRTADGLPETLELHVPPKEAELEVRLRDVSLDAAFDPSAFTLQPPAAP